MSSTETPRSAARGRSISRRTSGLPLRSVVSGSTTSGIVFIFASIADRVLRQLVEVRTLDEILNFRVALVAADGAHLLHAGVDLLRDTWLSISRVLCISCCCDSSRWSRSVSFT